MDFIGVLIIIFVVIGLFSAAAQGKKKKQDRGEGQPAPRPTMSDIQRAFMMMSGIDEEKEQQAPTRAPSYPRPAPSPFSQPSAPLTFDEGASSYGAARSGSLSNSGSRSLDYTPLTRSGSLDYTPLTRSGSLNYTPLSREGDSGGYTFASESITETAETVTELQESLGEVYGADLSEGDGQVHHKAHSLRLFQNQGDYVRAVIYSEILSRKARGRRA